MKRWRAAVGALAAATVAVGPAVGPAFADTIRQQQWHLEAMHAPEMWRTTEGQGVTVAVIDGGFDLQHPDLAGQFLPGRDFGGSPGGVGSDPDGHGTGMAGLIAGTGKGLGGTGAHGLAPGVKLLPLKINNGAVESLVPSDFTGQLSAAITYAADRGAKVVSISQAMSEAVPSPEDVATLRGAVAAARAKGVLVVASVGNDARKGNPVEIPAALPGVVGVGATDRDGAVTDESGYGPQVVFVAPGKDLIAACTASSGYCRSHGTSDATALVSASAALLWSAHPDWSANQVLRVLINTADGPKGGSARTDRLGYGSVRPWIALAAPGDPGPADLPPLPIAEAAPSTTPSTAPSSVAAATPGSAPKADASSGPGGSILPIAAGAVAALAVVAAVVFAVLRRRRGSTAAQ
ncbi:type VII secretion-associated serine protease mycosin [Streptomyces sp. NRRL WC-3742]|uniref:type VII secretion-associated serine protease mycosin n=1 Tax=Streptomyces sp. NRRL WC-3742 TaxID=1463934 RepID=UPI0004C787FB|nr:type VII secretion-associated serine protease mycosin [Streptomyces sp. NRRL WC-3742]